MKPDRISRRVWQIGAELLRPWLRLSKEKSFPKKAGFRRSDALPTYRPEDGHIFWNDDPKPSMTVTGTHPLAGVFTFWKRNGLMQRLKLLSVSHIKNQSPNFRHAVGSL